MNFARVLVIFAGIFIFVTPNSIPSAYAVIETVNFVDKKTEQRYKNLIAELRCLVCQNQNIAESDADLAKDLRRKTAQMLNAGESDRHIRNYMRERYGNFILYKPPFEGVMVLLWLGPIGLLVALLIGIFTHIKRRQSEPSSQTLDVNEERQRNETRNIMRDTPELDD